MKKTSNQFKKDVEATLRVTHQRIDTTPTPQEYQAYYNISKSSLFQEFDHDHRMKLVGISLLMSSFQKRLLQLWRDRGYGKISLDEYREKRKNILTYVANNCERYKLSYQVHPEEAQFRSDYTLEEIKALPMGEEMDFTAQSMCNSGGCTD